MQNPKESVLNSETARKIVDATMELTLRPKVGDRAKVIAAAFRELNDILDEECHPELKKIIDELNELSSQEELKMNNKSENIELPETYNILIETLAKKHFNVETIKTRNSDDLDFYNVSILSIRDALKDAFLAGLQVGNT